MTTGSGVIPGRPASLAATVTLAFLGAAVVPAVGCVSRSQYSAVEQERDLLSTANLTLKQEKEALETRLAELEAREKDLGSKLEESEEESRKLKGTYDGLVASLKEELQSGHVQIEQLRDGLSVNLAQEILFDSGSAALDTSGREILTRVAAQLKKSSYQIVVTGHTDNKPIGAGLVDRYPTNWELAAARAASVVRLFADSGLAARRLLAASVADTQPVAANKTPEGRARNRRIEIRMRPVAVEG